MATIKRRPQTPPTEINVFLGLNEDPNGALSLKLGEASRMLNFRITQSMKLKQREGYKRIFDSLTGPVRGMWYGEISSTAFFLFANNGHLYSGNLTDGTKTDLGTLTDAPTNFFYYGSKLYIQDTAEYRSFDGTTLATVAGYRPLIAINCNPDGGIVIGESTLYEEVNLLTGAKHQTFSGDSTKTVFQLAETNITSVDFVKVDGVLKTEGVGYTVDLLTGEVTLVTAPATGEGNVDIGWTKDSGQRSDITQMRFAQNFEGRIFLYGHPTNINQSHYNGIAVDTLSAEYFPANAYIKAGTGQYAITDITPQFDRALIFTEGDSYYTYYDTITLLDGSTVPDFPVKGLNGAKGNIAPGQTKLLNNNPVTVWKGVYEWQPRDVKEETNAIPISKRVQPSLDDIDLTQAITADWEERQELWLCVGSTVWIYNYRNDTWYKYDNIPATCFLTIDGKLYFGTNGSIEKFDSTMRNDNGVAINAVWEMGFFDFGAEHLNKYMNNIWVSIKPEIKTSLDLQTVTNNEGTTAKQTIYYNLATFAHCDFNHFSFNTSLNPQPFYVEVQAMGFCYFKIILSNSSLTNTATVLSINMPSRYGGKVR